MTWLDNIGNSDNIKIVSITISDGRRAMYNIEQLKMFTYAVELGSFSASARKLGKVQSAVSQGISNLEIDFNVQLFDRSTRKPTLTAQGEQIFKQVKAIILQVEELNSSINAIYNQEEGLVRIAIDDALMLPSLPKVLDEFSRTFPATEIELMAAASTDVNVLVSEDRVDIGLMFTDLAFFEDTEPCFIGNLPFVAVCHPEHALSEVTVVKLPDFIPHRQIIPRGNKGKVIDHFLVVAGKVWWANSFVAIKEMILHSSVGWAYLPSYLVESEIQQGRLSKINVSFDHKTWSPPVDLVVSKNKKKGPALLWLESNLKTLLD